MARFAIVSGGFVANIAEASAEFAQSQGWVAAPDSVSIGWLYDGVTFTEPESTPIPVPQSVTMRQARLALLGAGMLDSVGAALAAITDPAMRQAAEIEWEYAAEVERNAGLVQMLGPALGLTEAQLDALFIAAGGL
jgi:hypothetical protein